jgi:hypothetical protein
MHCGPFIRLAAATALSAMFPAEAIAQADIHYRVQDSARAPAFPAALPRDGSAEAATQYRIEDAMQTAPMQSTKSAAHEWEAGFLTLSAIDAAVTIQCLDRQSCAEHNPIWGHHPSTSTILLSKVGLGAIHFGVFKLLATRDPKSALRLAQISAIGQAGVLMISARLPFK